MKTKSLLNWKVQLAFGAAFLILLVVGAVSYRGMLVSSESARWVRHSHEVLEKLQGYGYAAEGSTPERLHEINRDDLALWKKLVKEAGIPLE